MRSIVLRAVVTASAFSLSVPGPLSAQQRSDRDPEVRIERLPGAMSIAFGNSNRAVLGVTLASNTRGDTAGVRIQAVDADGPAAKSGIKAGDVITAINGVSLRVSAEDADDPALGGIAERRLTRTLAKAKAGDAVELRVGSGGASRTVSVKTVTASELDGSGRTRVASRTSPDDEKRGVIGLSIGGSGNMRDTLGLFINSVVANGPAEKAGLVEGERIASVNGMDVRVPREDVEDASAMSARANRFIREVQKVAPGSNVALRVYSGGRYRDVTVKTVRGSELPSQGFRMSIGDGGMSISLPRTPNALREGGVLLPRGTDGRMMQLGPGTIRFREYGIDVDRSTIERAIQELRRNLQDMGRDFRFELRNDSTIVRDRVAPTVRTVVPRRATAIQSQTRVSVASTSTAKV